MFVTLRDPDYPMTSDLVETDRGALQPAVSGQVSAEPPTGSTEHITNIAAVRHGQPDRRSGAPRSAVVDY